MTTDIQNPNCDPTQLHHQFTQWYQQNIAHHNKITTGWCFSTSDIIKWQHAFCVINEQMLVDEQDIKNAQTLLQTWEIIGIIKKLPEHSNHSYTWVHQTPHTTPTPKTLTDKILEILLK